ncbi:putative arrestin protein [Daldinia childiae]|uniref:putative arrestin protein n=1 Tax=Daldinia childiae TaxID=326645 RepID=UPI00144655CC|nr:putative arrestin protein [Daldinia childiae]KAF3062194.1 putative arrestin protein [Daldinia childiae]
MASTSSSEHSRVLGGYARKLSIAPKSSINIHINNHYHSRVYTTGSEISGHVTITPQTDTRFDTLQVVLLGTSKTRIDALNIPQTTSHTFLKLIMPIPESSYPIPRVFEAGLTYTVPFTFVIPSTLTLNACSHQVANNSVQDHHMRLPPTLGSWEKDDFAPHMSRVQYVIKARAYKDEPADGLTVKVMEAGQEIKVLPAALEDAPLSITKHDDLYIMSKSKSLRKTIISPKTGKVTITAAQPSAAMLSPDGQTSTSTTVPLYLEFEPASIDARPPKITGIASKVTAVTYFSAGGVSQYPNLKDWHSAFGSEGRGSYSGTTSVTTGPLGDVKWSRHLTAQARRDSGYGSDNLSSDTDLPPRPLPHKTKGNLPSPIFHAAQLQVPIQLPVQKKTFVPTFHSCITSRVYVLWLTVTVVSGGYSTHITLGVPLQIGVRGTVSHLDNTALPPSFEEVEEADADEYLRPRVMSLPTIDFHQNGALPGYADLDHHRRRTVVAH